MCIIVLGSTKRIAAQWLPLCGSSAGTSGTIPSCSLSIGNSRLFGDGKLAKSLRRGEDTTMLENWKLVNLRPGLLLEGPRVRRLEGILASEDPLRDRLPRRRRLSRLTTRMTSTNLHLPRPLGTPAMRTGEPCLHLNPSDCWIHSITGGLILTRNQYFLHCLNPGNGDLVPGFLPPFLRSISLFCLDNCVLLNLFSSFFIPMPHETPHRC